jgi:hypothetical protein
VFRQHLSQHIKFIPGAGAENSSSLISIAIAFAENFLVLLDNDIDGKKAKIRYTEYFGDSIKNNIHFYNTKNSFKLKPNRFSFKMRFNFDLSIFGLVNDKWNGFHLF